MPQAAKIEISPTGAPNEAATATGAADTPAIAVLFRNGKDTPRGAWFGADSLDHAIAGAAEMGMQVIKADTLEIIQLALRLPKGRVFDSGKLFTPLVQVKVYEKLLAYLPKHAIKAKPRLVMSATSSGGGGDVDAQDASDSVPEGTRPTDWGSIKIGALVLAEEGRSEGWFEAIVLEVRPKDVFKLRYRDYPDDPTVTRHVSRLALMMTVDTPASA